MNSLLKADPLITSLNNYFITYGYATGRQLKTIHSVHALRSGQLFSNLARQLKSLASITMLQGFLKTRLTNWQIVYDQTEHLLSVSDTTALFAAENQGQSIL